VLLWLGGQQFPVSDKKLDSATSTEYMTFGPKSLSWQALASGLVWRRKEQTDGFDNAGG
jgi:hypothetical protein